MTLMPLLADRGGQQLEVPTWYLKLPASSPVRKKFDWRLRTFNDKELRRWIADPSYDPVIQVRHRRCAN